MTDFFVQGYEVEPQT